MICVKRSSEDWSTVLSTNTDGTCPAGYLKCGSSEDLRFCTKESLCPITTMITELSSSGQCQIADNCILYRTTGERSFFSSMPRSVTKGLRFYREDNIPLSEFRLTEPSYSIFNGERFALLLDFPPLPRPYTWSITLDTTSENELFRQNGLFYTILSELSILRTGSGYYGIQEGENAGSNRYWGLVARRFTPWKASCRDKMPALISQMDFGTNLNKVQLALLIMNCISFGVLIILIPFIQLCFTCCCSDYNDEIERCSEIFEKIAEFCQVPVKIWAVALTLSTRNLFVDVAKGSCSDYQTNDTIVFLGKQLKDAADGNLIGMGSLFGKLLLDLLIYLYKRHQEGTLTCSNPFKCSCSNILPSNLFKCSCSNRLPSNLFKCSCSNPFKCSWSWKRVSTSSTPRPNQRPNQRPQRPRRPNQKPKNKPNRVLSL